MSGAPVVSRRVRTGPPKAPGGAVAGAVDEALAQPGGSVSSAMEAAGRYAGPKWALAGLAGFLYIRQMVQVSKWNKIHRADMERFTSAWN